MLDKVKELLRALENTSVEEVEIETDGLKVRAKFKREGGAVASVPVQETKTAEPVTPKDLEEPVSEKYYVVEAPMVGTFYRAPAPGAEPFVKEGDFVEKGQTLCIIEALKVMNEIESEVSGIVRKILVENGQPVEYGQPLFYIEPR